MATFGDIKKHLLNIGAQDTGGEAEDMVGVAINHTYRRILALSNMDQMKREFSLSTVSGTGQYGLPLYVQTDLNFDDDTNDRSLEEMSSREFDKRLPGTDETGIPSHYYKVGKKGIQKQPSAAGVIGVVSSSTADTASTYVTILGYVSGVLTREKVTLTGTTIANTTNSFTTIERVVKTADDGTSFQGNITITDASANTLAVIPTWVGSPTYIWVEFWPEPDAVYTYTLRAMGYKPDLVNDVDWPDYDENFHDLLLYGPGAEVLPSFGQENVALQYNQIFQQRWREFKRMVDPSPNLVQTFADISMGRYMPIEPYIKGVHYGLATGQ